MMLCVRDRATTWQSRITFFYEGQSGLDTRCLPIIIGLGAIDHLKINCANLDTTMCRYVGVSELFHQVHQWSVIYRNRFRECTWTHDRRLLGILADRVNPSL